VSFLRWCDPRSQNFESIYRDLLSALQQEGHLALLEGDEDIYENDNEASLEEECAMLLNKEIDEGEASLD